MKINSISSLALAGITLGSIARSQVRLSEIGEEVSTGRHADVGRTLGSGISQDLDLRGEAADLGSLQSSNGIVGTRLSQIQSAMSQITSLADGFMSSLLAMKQGGGDHAILEADAKGRLATLRDILSTSSGGAYLLGGTNVSVPPLNDYLATPPAGGKVAVDAAFAGAFGMSQADPAVASISGAQMESYLEGAFGALFADPGWQAFSTADDLAVTNRISPGEVVESSVSANAKGIRDLMKSLVAVVGSGTSQLNADAFSALMSKLINVTGTVSANLSGIQAAVGVSQERLAKANDRIVLQMNYLERQIGNLENVDTAKASIDLNAVSQQLQASYTITLRLQNLSLLNYLPTK